jgi:hypothetical protein
MADPDGLMSAPPGTDTDAGSANTVSGSPAGAIAAALAREAQISQESLTAGDSIGDVMPLPPNPVSVNYGSALGADSAQQQVPEQHGGSRS